ncbi:hypothetical protein Lepto7376_3305 [[Leptolyngbya] sp. PCC 7376]|uniref:PTPA-CTERM sorting domain-containing protein n=1 Tax=[Leptolyngbya] sp. PCC 7376 TaxID=111781 RepID=UPI00029F4941|nr:PTPA-CTERM sorting domain-containing protein [[Leptolyngbya] sp. PCC 7376]AFY39529.1 hypothetical protein Lepto7376_3305 [[Leptolyngbya] sp. PCC 7376]
MKSLIGKLGLGSAVIGLAMMTAPAAEAFVITTTNFGSYDVDVIFGNFNSNEDILADQDWWGNQGLADEIGAALFVDWEKFHRSQQWSDPGDVELHGAMLAFELNLSSRGDRAGTVLIESEEVRLSSPLSQVNFNSRGDRGILGNSGFYYLTGTSVPTPTTVVPTPAAVLPGLFGMGLSAMRKRRDSSSENI